MAVSIIEYWREISIALGGIVTFIFGRKSAKFLEKRQQADAVTTMQKTYDVFLEHYEKQYKELIERMNKLQEAFLTLQLNYSKELEVSAKWQKLHSELEKQYKDLEKKYNLIEIQYKEADKKHSDLEKLYSKLKSDFDKHKKSTI